jgi:4-hydroxybenzoate polyprenyltransferase
MKALVHFFRLVRIGNLLVMALTMGIIQVFLTREHTAYFKDEASEALFSLLEPSYFSRHNLNSDLLFLVLSVVFIAAAGNIINDYFDVKADRVNKPNKLIVGKHIKRRWAIMLNWIFNLAGLGLAAYLSVVQQNFWIVIIAFITINFLWLYSALYKRKIFVGNLLIAVLVGIVPLYVLIYNLPYSAELFPPLLDLDAFSLMTYEVVFTVAIIAFVINLMREIIKDIADIRGDMYLKAKTIPIALGIRQSKLILTILLVPLLFLLAFYLYNMNLYNVENSARLSDFIYADGYLGPNFAIFNGLVIGAGLSCLVAFGFLLSANKRKNYLRASNLLKVAMLLGILSPVFI